MRAFVMLLAVLALTGCAAGTAVTEDFDTFWSAFTTAVAADDPDGVRNLTRFPFLFEGEPRDSNAFADIYAALFDESARACLSTATPIAEGDGYVTFCGPIIYVFDRDAGGWHFAEFAVDPESGFEDDHEPGGETAALGSWRVIDGRTAPWATSANDPRANTSLTGTRVSIGAAYVDAPAPLGCRNAEHEFVATPAEGLFQGNLPAPADAAARRLGLTGQRTITLRVHCDSGVFDYHHLPGDTLLLGLDGVVWKLTPEPAVTHVATVRAFLARHMAGDTGFTPAAVTARQGFLSTSLMEQVAQYFGRPDPGDEPPPINGDPFTDSQELPDRFTLRVIDERDDGAIVRVLFRHGSRARPADFLLVRQGARWLLDDIRYEDGTGFREHLQQ